MSKSEFKDRIQGVLLALFGELGFKKRKGGVFERRQGEDVVVCLVIRFVVAKLPASVVQIDVDVTIRSVEIAGLCRDLFDRDFELPTLWGPLGRFVGRTDYVSSYRFDWNRSNNENFSSLKNDFSSFDDFARSLRGSSDLDIERLSKIPALRKNMVDGLGETYRFTLPEIAVVIYKLNSREQWVERALRVALDDKSGRLSERAKQDLKNFAA